MTLGLPQGIAKGRGGHARSGGPGSEHHVGAVVAAVRTVPNSLIGGENNERDQREGVLVVADGGKRESISCCR